MPRGNLLPQSVPLDRFDKQVIICLIAVFLVLFVWLLWENIQPPHYAFWTFTALLTLIFVGFLRATGVFRTGWGALGGSVAVYVGLLLLTGKTFDRDHDLTQEISKLNVQVKSLQDQLKKIDPAKYALQQFFGFLQQKNFKDAYNLISDARKLERKRSLPSGIDDYSQYMSTFDNTESYRNFTYELVREETENERGYRVTYDVLDNVPHNRLFESRIRPISSFSGAVDREEIIRIVLDNLREYYVVPESAIPAIQEHVKARTMDDILDPTFIGEMVIDLRNVRNIELQQAGAHPTNASIWRYLRYDNVVMIKQGSAEWKIRSGLNNPVIALYK